MGAIEYGRLDALEDALGGREAIERSYEQGTTLALTDDRGQADGDLLAYLNGTFARLAAGDSGSQLVVRSDGTLAWITPPAISAAAWGAGPAATGDANRNAINTAIQQAHSGGGGRVSTPAGALTVTPTLHPQTNSRLIGIQMLSGVRVEGQGEGITILRLPANFQAPANMTPNSQIYLVNNLNYNTPDAAGADHDMTLADLTIDGNGASQTILTNGSVWTKARRCFRERVTVQDCYGTTSGPPGETFHFDDNATADCFTSDCHVVGTIADTGTGFSANEAFGSHWSNCTSRGMGHGNGFTAWTSADLTYSGCLAYANADAGFNLDASEAVTYDGCLSGGRMSAAVNNPFIASHVAEGNGNGWQINNSQSVTLDGCQARYNATGLIVTGGADSVRVRGGSYEHNTILDVETDGTVTNFQFGAFGPNTKTQFGTSATGTNTDVMAGQQDQKVDASVSIDGDFTVNKQLAFRRNGNLRWLLRMEASTEPGSNVGSDLLVSARDDAGAGFPAALTLTRRTSIVQAGKGFAHATKAGVPADADFAAAPPDGVEILDTTDNRVYFRVNGVWRYLDLGLDASLLGNYLTSGEETFDRRLVTGSAGLTSGRIPLCYFTARKTETVNNIVSVTGSTAAGATPTLCKMGIWRVNADNTLTLLAASANDTTLWSATNTLYTRALPGGVSKVAGQRYALGLLCVSTAALPSICAAGFLAGGNAAIGGLAPRIVANYGDSQTNLGDLAAPTHAAGNDTTTQIWMAVTP